MKVRVKFRKYGVMKYIGHLDMMRYFQKAIRRAELPIAYSEGYSPHQIMSFASPLGVGLTSNGEYMDIVLKCEEADLEQFKTALQAEMAAGTEIVSMNRLAENAGNAMASVAAARYTVCFRKGCEPNFDWTSQIFAFSQKLTIPVIKQSKKSTREIDIKPSLFSFEEADGTISMLVAAGSADNIKPELAVDAFCREYGFVPQPHALLITREEIYGKDKDGAWIPLEALGNDG